MVLDREIKNKRVLDKKNKNKKILNRKIKKLNGEIKI